MGHDISHMFLNDEYSTDPSSYTQITYTTNWPLTCPSCGSAIYNWDFFYKYCPYCGSPLYPTGDERLDVIARRIEEIKKMLEELKREKVKGD